MPRHRIQKIGVLVALALGSAPACSSSSGSPDAAAPDGATTDSPAGDDASLDGVRPDASAQDAASDGPLPDAPAQDAPMESSTGDAADACAPSSVWSAGDLTFSLHSVGGFVAPPPPDAGCNGGRDVTFAFSRLDKTLVRQGCESSGRVDRTVALTDGEVAAIVTAAMAITTTCAVLCGADAPTDVLIVSASGVQTTYHSDFYAGCTGQQIAPPYVPFGELGAFELLLDQMIAQACNPDGGDSGASRCGVPGAAGPADASADS